jgi:hypothetical protein
MKSLSSILFLLGVFIFTQCNSSENSNESNTENEINNVQSSTEKSETCEITCPHCGHKKTEILPTEVCQIKYKCEKCLQTLTPKGNDCCVFCTYSTHKCPSKQTK